MAEHKGIGISAPQVGEAVRAIHINTGDIKYSMINPEIVRVWGEQEVKEGCLSFPGEYIKVTRPVKAQVKFIDSVTGVAKNLILIDDLAVQCLIHEVAHLDGKLLGEF